MPASAPTISSLAFLALRRWRLGLVLTTGFLLAGLIAYFAAVPFTLSTNVQINDAQTSQLQAFTNNFFALSKNQAAVTRKAQTPSQAAVDGLDRQDSYTNFVRFLAEERETLRASSSLRPGLDALESRLNESLASPSLNLRNASSLVRHWLKLSSTNPGELVITTYTGSRDLTYLVNAEYARFAVRELKSHEDREMTQIRSALEKERDYFREQFAIKNRELITFQSRPENVLSLASGPGVGNYISELLVRKNELQLRISENERTIQYLGGAAAARLAYARNLGGRSQATQLIEDNSLLKKQVSALDESIRKFTSATNGAVEAMRMHEELQKTSDREFHNFQDANDLLSRLAVYSVSIAGKFELEHVPEFEDTKKAVSPILLLALCFFLAQVTFAIALYRSATAPQPAMQATRLAEAIATPGQGRKINESSVKIVDLATGNFPREKPNTHSWH